MSKHGLRSKQGANSGLYTIDDDLQHKRGNKRYDILSQDKYESVVS